MTGRKNPIARPKDWWKGAVIYQIYPRSFQDSNADGIGDLNGIAARLREVASLGVDAIWLSPFFTSPMKDFGYDVSNYCDVDPMFGTLTDFQALVGRAHDLGLKVMIDLVLSHTSDQHPWFKDSRQNHDNPKSDWYVWADAKPDGTPPNNWLSIFGGSAWEWDARRMQYYLHNFLREQPDLNLHAPAVQDALLDVARFWLELGVDGFRLDTVNFYFHDRGLRDNPPNISKQAFEVPLSNPYAWQDHVHDKSQPENLDFLKRFRTLLDSYGEIATVGEVGDGVRALTTIAAYTAGQERLTMCYAFEFLSRIFGKAHFEKTIRDFETVIADGWGCWAFSNHDVERHVSRWAEFCPNREQLGRFCVALLMALRGSVCIYEGEELGLPEADVPFDLLQDPYGKTFWPEFKGRDGCRTPMVWDVEESNAGFSGANRTWLPIAATQVPHAWYKSGRENSATLIADYRRFIALRQTHPALRAGAIKLTGAPANVLAFERSAASERLLCAFNFESAPAVLKVPEGAALLAGLSAKLDDTSLRLGSFSAAYITLAAGGM